jgi:uncharacterized protein (TIGR03000 family)
MILVCVFVTGTATAQPLYVGGIGPPGYGPYAYRNPGPGIGWTYPGLPPGPFLTYAYPYSYWGYRGAVGATWTNGLHLAGPPVPVYGPIPGIFGAEDLNRQWQAHPSLGWGLGWFGVYSPSPRPYPLSVNPWPANDPRGSGRKHGRGYAGGVIGEPLLGPATPPAQSGGCLVLSVKVPQPAAEVYVDGVRMNQTGTDRLYESPPLEAGQTYQYELMARWIEGGATLERKKAVTGKPGEVVRVDFTTP